MIIEVREDENMDEVKPLVTKMHLTIQQGCANDIKGRGLPRGSGVVFK